MPLKLVSDAGQAIYAGGQPEALQKSDKIGQVTDDPVDSGGQVVNGGPIDNSSSVPLAAESQGTAGVVQQDGQIVQATPGQPRDLYTYLVYKPSSTPARVYAGRKTMFSYPGDQALYAILSRTLGTVRWVQIVAWKNNTSAAQQYQISYTTGLKITEGSEVNIGFNFGASFEGISIGLDYSQKTFKSTETTTTKTITLTVNVPAYSELVFYQKSYEFDDYVTFVLDAWGQEWNVGPWGGYTPLTSMHVLTQIMAEEYLTTSSPLPAGPGKMQVTTVGAPARAGTTRKRENTTEKCKNLLAKMGL